MDSSLSKIQALLYWQDFVDKLGIDVFFKAGLQIEDHPKTLFKMFNVYRLRTDVSPNMDPYLAVGKVWMKSAERWGELLLTSSSGSHGFSIHDPERQDPLFMRQFIQDLGPADKKFLDEFVKYWETCDTIRELQKTTNLQLKNK